MSILKAVRVAIFEWAAVEDVLVTVHFSSLVLMRLICSAFFFWELGSVAVVLVRPPLTEWSSEWIEMLHGRVQCSVL